MKTVFSTNDAGTTTNARAEKMNLDAHITTFTKINLNCIRDLNMKCKTIKFLGDNIEENLQDLGNGDFFLRRLMS